MKEGVVAAPAYHINDLCYTVAKGKRTKRQRPHSLCSFTVSNNSKRLIPSFSATSTAADSATAEEEEDTARCLILLSRGHFRYNSQLHGSSKQNNRSPQTAAERVGAAASGSGVYACKTCDRVFSSFQALGGHRTSHNKPKNEKKMADPGDGSPSPPSKKRSTPSLSLQLSTAVGGGGEGGRQLPSPRTHECSYCGAEFTSGQALGGHMRRHRAGPTSLADGGGVAEPKKSRNGLSLDLNFPAPEDENERLGYGGARREKSPEKLVISARTPTLVDCHF